MVSKRGERRAMKKIKLEHILLICAVVLLIGIAVAQFANQAADDYIKELDKRIESYER